MRIPREAKWVIGGTLALAGLRLVSALLTRGLYVSTLRTMDSERMMLKNALTKAARGEGEVCIAGVHEGVYGNDNPFVSTDVTHINCDIRNSVFHLDGELIPFNGIGTTFDGINVRVRGK